MTEEEKKEVYKKYPIIIGTEGKDDFWLKCADGTIHTWEERDEITEQLKKEKHD